MRIHLDLVLHMCRNLHVSSRPVVPAVSGRMPTGSSADPGTSEHFPRAKGCAVLCNMGHFGFLDHLVFGLLGCLGFGM